MANGDYLFRCWRSRPDPPRDRAPFADRRRGLRAVRPVDGADGDGGQTACSAWFRRSRRPGIPRDLFGLAKVGSHFRDLGEKLLYELTKLMTMSSADFLDEWFDTDVLKATMSASGIIGTFMGPRSPGTAYVLLHHYMGELDGAFRSWGFARGGTGAISNAIAEAARHFSAEIRTQVTVDQVTIKNGRATGVVLSTGEEIQAKVVVSSVDPKRTFLKMVDSQHLDAPFLKQVSDFKIRGSSAKVNLSLDALPDFTSHARQRPPSRPARSRSARAWTTSSAPMTTPNTVISRAAPTWTSSCRRCSTRPWRRRENMSCRSSCSTRPIIWPAALGPRNARPWATRSSIR